MLAEMGEALAAERFTSHEPDQEWDDGRRIACTVSETSPAGGGMIYLLGCPACLIAAHAWAMQGVEIPWSYLGEAEGERSIAGDVNATIIEAGLSLPLVPVAA